MSASQEGLRHFARADALLAQGATVEAIAAYRAGLSCRPGHADGWFNLGFAHRRAGHFHDALDCYARALSLGVVRPEQAHLNRAAILADHLRRDDEAEAELRQALAIAPGHPPALLNLGNLYEERGQRSEAIACYGTLIEQDNDATACGEALARLAALRPATGLDDPQLARLRAAAASTTLPAPVRANLGFALGRTLDALEQDTAAFDAFMTAKRLVHQDAPAYDRACHERFFQALMEVPGAGGAQAHQEPLLPTPLFICGMFRSGSTLTEQVLAAHPQVAAGGELDLLPRLVAGALAPFPQSLQALEPAHARELARRYHLEACSRQPGLAAGRRYLTDKRPDNLLRVGLIKRLFPDARIVLTSRHPLDIALSIMMQHLNPRALPYAGTLEDIGHYCVQVHRIVSHWHSLYPRDIHEFHYDAFVADPERQLGSLLEFLELPWDAACMEFHRVPNTVKTASYWQVRRPLYGEASGRWRRYRDVLAPLAEQLLAADVPVPGWR